MYMWLVLSTFLAILAGYSLPTRSDLSDQKDVPMAAAQVHRMIINHKTSLEYVKSRKWPYFCGGVDVSSGVTIEICENSDRIGYEADVITSEMVEDFKHESFVYDEENYVSRIFCLNEDDTEAEDCLHVEGNDKKRFLVTYGDLHEKWISANDLTSSGGSGRLVVMPREDLLKGLGENFAHDTLAGYVREDDEGVHIINSWGTKVFTLLPWMWEYILSSDKCNEKFNGSCIIYMSAI